MIRYCDQPASRVEIQLSDKIRADIISTNTGNLISCIFVLYLLFLMTNLLAYCEYFLFLSCVITERLGRVARSGGLHLCARALCAADGRFMNFTRARAMQGPPCMMSASEVGGVHGKADVVREVA